VVSLQNQNRKHVLE